MTTEDQFEGISLTSFEEAALNAISQAPPTPTPTVPQRFVVVELAVSIGGFVGRPQYAARVRRS